MVKLWQERGRSVALDSAPSTNALFDTVPKDYLSLFPAAGTDYHRVIELLGFKKNDVARATNVAVHSVRYDPPRMPKELQERVQEWAIVLNLVAQFFGDEQKVVLWFKTPNPLLGDLTPRDMIRIGRFQKLRRFIQNALSENQPTR